VLASELDVLGSAGTRWRPVAKFSAPPTDITPPGLADRTLIQARQVKFVHPAVPVHVFRQEVTKKCTAANYGLLR